MSRTKFPFDDIRDSECTEHEVKGKEKKSHDVISDSSNCSLENLLANRILSECIHVSSFFRRSFLPFDLTHLNLTVRQSSCYLFPVFFYCFSCSEIAYSFRLYLMLIFLQYSLPTLPTLSHLLSPPYFIVSISPIILCCSPFGHLSLFLSLSI